MYFWNIKLKKQFSLQEGVRGVIISQNKPNSQQRSGMCYLYVGKKLLNALRYSVNITTATNAEAATASADVIPALLLLVMLLLQLLLVIVLLHD